MDWGRIRTAAVGEGVVWGFFYVDALEGGVWVRGEDGVEGYGEIFRGWDNGGEEGKGVEVLVVEGFEEVRVGEGVEVCEVGDHAGGGIDRAAEGDFDDVVVAMAVRVIALAEGLAILFGGEAVGVEAVGGGEVIAAGEMGDGHQFPSP